MNKLATKSGKKFTVAGPAGMVKTVLEDSSMDVLLNARESKTNRPRYMQST